MARSLDRRLSSLESAEREKMQVRTQRAIVTMIVEEAERNGIGLEQAIRNVVDDQYDDLSKDAREIIAGGWTRTIGSWSPIEWLATIGRIPELSR
jgi:hypothetical protein